MERDDSSFQKAEWMSHRRKPRLVLYCLQKFSNNKCSLIMEAITQIGDGLSFTGYVQVECRQTQRIH